MYNYKSTIFFTHGDIQFKLYMYINIIHYIYMWYIQGVTRRAPRIAVQFSFHFAVYT